MAPLAVSLRVADAAAAQSGFIAGFTYYELSRQSAANAERVPLYPLLLLGAFTSSVVCSGITAYLHLWVDECEPCREKELEALHSKRSCFQAVSLAYWCNRLAFYLYCASMPLMGKVYNPEPATPSLEGWMLHIQSLHHLVLGYHMLIVGAVALLLDIVFAVLGCLARPNQRDEREGDEEVNRSMDSMGNRALLMVGFIQHASARFIALEFPADGHPYELYLNVLFPTLVSLGCGLLQAVVYLSFMTTTQIRTPAGSLSGATMQCLFVLFRLCEIFFKCGVFLVLAGAALTGYGCSCPCGEGAAGPCAEARQVPRGACYVRVAYVPLACCLGSIFLVIFFQVWSCRLLRRATQSVCEADLSGALDSLATVATLAAGFVMYNITTFNTDVIDGPFPADGRPLLGLTTWGYAFLWANWLAFSLGLAVSCCVQMIQSRAAQVAEEARAEYWAQVESMLAPVEVMTLLSLVFFVLAFGLLGMAKMEPHRPESLLAALVLLVVLARQSVKLRHLRRQATDGCSTSLAVLQGKLEAIRSPAMMFGGFAYNGVSFLFRSNAALAPSYVVGMSGSFACALYLTFTSASIDFHTARKASMADALGETMIQARRSYGLCLAMFMMAFTIMGYIKLWDYGSALTEQAQLSWRYGGLQFVGGLIGLGSLWNLRHTIRLEAKRVVSLPGKVPSCEELCMVRQFLAHAKSGSSSTSFQVGNVFYEVLFSGINLQKPWANFAYFGFAVSTLVLGSIALMISCELFFSIEEMSEVLKCLLAERLTMHFRMIRYLYMASLLTWLFSMLFSSEVKYPQIWWASFSWSCLGLMVLCSTCCWIRCVATRPTCCSGESISESEESTESD